MLDSWEEEEKEIFNKMSSGYNFMAYINRESEDPKNQKVQEDNKIVNYLYIYGIIDQLKSYNLKKETFELTKPFSDKNSSSNSENFQMKRINNYENFEPIQVSCNKMSMAAILKQNTKNENTNESTDAITNLEKLSILTEIKSSLKAKKLTFQNYFFDDLNNESLYDDGDGGGKRSENTNFLTSEDNLKKKILNLINNIDKYQEDLKALLDILKSKTTGGREVDLLILFLAVYESKEKNFHMELFTSTRLMIMGEFALNCIEHMAGKDYFKKWLYYFTENLIYELPIIILPIKQVELGENHILILTIDGIVYSWGDGSLGATGNGIKEFHTHPSKVIFPSDNTYITRIACGSRHSMALDSQKCLYSWGFGQKGRLGHDNENNVRFPKLIELLSSSKILMFDAGDNYSACITETKQLYSWGAGEYGRLGHAGINDQHHPKKVNIPEVVIYVKCEYFCMIVFTVTNGEENKVYAIGAKYLFLPDSNEMNRIQTREKTQLMYLK